MSVFLENHIIVLYCFIFFGKILEVAVSTVRIVLINRGEKVKGSILAFFDILLWVLITGTVLAGFQNDWLRLIIFAIAFSLGNFVGSWIEDKLAFGLSSIQVIVPECAEAQLIADKLRENNFAVTIVQGQGKDGCRELMILHLKRKRIPNAVHIIKEELQNAVIVVNDVKNIHGGFIRK